jgi:hypothetical protein
MAVTFTSNIGLAKPDATELALNWARATLLADDNNVIITDKTDINLVSYSPVPLGQFGNPDNGVGVRNGEYQDIQGFIIGSFRIKFVDPGVTGGSGEYAISLPFPADGSFHTVGNAFGTTPGVNSCIGEGYITDASVVNNSGTVALDVITLAGVGYARLVTEAYPGKTASCFGNSTPFLLATGDLIAGSFNYKRV